MHDSEPPRPADPATAAIDARLRALLAYDWPAAGLGPPAAWHPSVAAALPLVALAAVPMTLMIGPTGILAPNAGTLALFGEPAAGGITGRSVFEVLPDNAPFYSEVLSRVYAGEACHYHDQPIRLARGGKLTTAWFDLEFTPVADAGGTVHAVLGIAMDVTRHVRRIRGLSDSEQRLRLALEAWGMVGIWDLDVETNISTADANVARTFGLPAYDCERGLDDGLFLQAIHGEDRPRVTTTLRRAIENRQPYRCRYRVLSHDGDLRWVIVSGKPSYDEHGKLVRILGVVIDVTDQMETASALAESRFQFQTLTETLPQLVWSADAQGRHDYFSARWYEFTGMSADSVTEDTWKQLVHPQDWPAVARKWDEARRNGTPYDVDYRFRHHSGNYRWLRVMALPIRDDEDRITRWFGTSTDVHDAYLATEERERLARQLQRIATEDQLTEALTRRAFMERATGLLCQALPMALLMLDVDHFKAINDAHGHPDGDKVLAVVARRIRAGVGKRDLVGRLGGEEFAVLLQRCTPRQAMNVAERIRKAVEGEPVALEGGRIVPVTLSIGVTAGQPPKDDLERLLSLADKALYQAKASGRNRSVFLDDDPDPA